MEDEIFNASGYADQNPMVIDTIMFGMGSLVQADPISSTHIMSSHSTIQGEPIYDLQFENFGAIIDQEASVSRNGSFRSSNSICNRDLQEQIFRGASFSANSLGNGLATGVDLHENFNGVKISSASGLPLEDLSTYISDGCDIDTSNLSLPASMNCENHGIQNDHELLAPKSDASLNSQLDIKWGFEKSLGSLEFAGKTPTGMVFPPEHLNMPTFTDWSSEISCSGSLGDVGFGSEQASNCEEPSLDLCSYRPILLSHELSGSKYLHVLQQILAEVASFSLGDLENPCGSPEPSRIGVKSSSYCAEKGVSLTGSDEFCSAEESRYNGGRRTLAIQRREVEGKKAQLLALLQMVDTKYNQILDKIHTVISAFRVATELDAQIHARFTLSTISSVYKKLRDRIANQILANEECIGRQSAKGERSFESSFIQNQWALQQLRRRGHRLWKPQRGLPEKSVSVLRAWMFQNFLYPYPDDAEKHLLSIRSGLTRSQVSNWFINARVRLWKPMIEEMHTELNNRQIYQAEDETSSDHSNNIAINDQSFLMN